MLRFAVGMWLELAPKAPQSFQMARSPFSASWDLSLPFSLRLCPKVFGAGGPASCSWGGARCQVWGPEASRGGVGWGGSRRKTRRMRELSSCLQLFLAPAGRALQVTMAIR